LGSDLLAVLKILKMPEQVLAKPDFERLCRVQADAWYPVDWLTNLTTTLERHVGRYGLIQMGRRMFELTHRGRVLQHAKTAKDLIYGLDDMYRHANRGRGIGGFQVLKFGAGIAEVEKTTGQHCLLDQGLITEGLLAVGCACNVSQTRCVLENDDTCVFEITSAFADKRWGA